jgi:hypothetical protein
VPRAVNQLIHHRPDTRRRLYGGVVLKWKHGAPDIEKVSTWTKVFQHHNEGDWRVYVRVRLDDGAIYAGTLLHHTSDLENDDRELILGRPGLATKSPAER